MAQSELVCLLTLTGIKTLRVPFIPESCFHFYGVGVHNQPSNNPFHTNIFLWKRYIDDILLLWNGTELDHFIAYVNSKSDFLSFTAEYDLNKVNFLDLKRWHVLQADPILKNVCDKPPLFSFRKSQSIKDTVVHNMIQPISPPTWLPAQPVGFYRCGRCVHCSNSSDTKYFLHPRTGKKKYNIDSFINCNSTHVEYKLKCPCSLVCVGQTK